MTEVARITPVTPAPTQSAVKRANAEAAFSAAGAAPPAVKPVARIEAAKPFEPVVRVEPSTRLTITKDETANTFVYRSINAETGEVVWQYPVEQVLRMAHRLRALEGLDGHQLDEKV